MSSVIAKWTDPLPEGWSVYIYDTGRVELRNLNKFVKIYAPSEHQAEAARGKAIDKVSVEAMLVELGMEDSELARQLATTASAGGSASNSAIQTLVKLRDEMRSSGKDLDRPEPGTNCPTCDTVVDYFEDDEQRQDYNQFKREIITTYLERS